MGAECSPTARLISVLAFRLQKFQKILVYHASSPFLRNRETEANDV